MVVFVSDALLADRYKLVRRIGEGGYGTVWLARDEQLRRDVAIKRLSVKDRSRAESEKKSDRFRREAITMAKIDHANVVTIYDVGTLEEEQEIFLVMELLEGRSLLEQLVLDGPLQPQRALDRFVEALEGLQAAHDVGVVHKDLKPANLFLHRSNSPREQMKLIDFGIARMESLTKLTGTGRMAGSPRYLAPEYIMGESVTPAIDIYQTALILVEALSGEPCVPRGLKYFETCERHILSELEISDDLRASPLGPVLDRALQRHPLDRYRSASEFADELRKIRPEEIPAFELDETVQMEVPRFEEMDIPSSEATVSGMVDRLREEEAALRPASVTKRYAGVQQQEQEHEFENKTTTRLSPLSGPQPVPTADPLPQLPPREQPQTRTQLRVMAAGALFIAVVVVAGTILMRTEKREPVVDPGLPPSKDTCMLQCTQWYQDREVRGACQDLCRSTRPPTEPPFPMIDAVEPQISEETETEPSTSPTPSTPDTGTLREADAGQVDEPSERPPRKPTVDWVPIPAGKTKPTKFRPTPKKWAP